MIYEQRCQVKGVCHLQLRFVCRAGSLVCVCVVVIPFILDVRLVDVPAGVTQEEVTQDFSSTVLLRCLP